MQTKAIKTFPETNLSAVRPLDAHEGYAAAEQIRIDQDTPRRAEKVRSAQETRSDKTRCQFDKNMPNWLRAKLLEQPKKTARVHFCIFVGEQLLIHNLCKTDNVLMDAFSGMGSSVTDSLVTA